MRLLICHLVRSFSLKRPRLAARLGGVVLAALAAQATLTACTALVIQPLPIGLGPEPAEQYVPPEPPSGYTAKAIQYAPQDMVSAANPLAVQAGVAILAQGGSAIDAAIAVQMVLNLVEPQSSGMGGGAFLLHLDRGTAKVLAYDGREMAPKAATADMFIGADGKPLAFTHAVDGGLAVGTPGLLRMLEAAHKAHGKLPWAQLFAPAAALADAGFAISQRMSTSIAGSAARIKAQGEPGASYFLKADGTAKATGTLLRNPELAATFRTIAAGGANAFYTGDIARDIVAKVSTHPTNPGRLTLADMSGYVHKVREPVCGVYRVSYRICGAPAPSSGGISVLQTLGILNNFDLAGMKANTVDSVHLVSEAYRLAYADQAKYIADSDFVSVPVAGMLDPAYLKARSTLISMTKTIGTPVAGMPAEANAAGTDTSLNFPSTSHMSIVDRNGNAISMTTTIENGFGSLQMVRGFLLNN